RMRCRPSILSRFTGVTTAPVDGCTTLSSARDASQLMTITSRARMANSVAGCGRALPPRSTMLRKRSMALRLVDLRSVIEGSIGSGLGACSAPDYKGCQPASRVLRRICHDHCRPALGFVGLSQLLIGCAQSADGLLAVNVSNGQVTRQDAVGQQQVC